MSDNNLFRKVEKSKVQTTGKYDIFGFNRNPFPRLPGVIINDPDNRQNGSIYFNDLRQEEASQFENILIPTEDRVETKSIAFLMDYATRRGRGIGKTAFLNYKRGQIMSDLGASLSNNTEVLFAVYVAPVPSDNYRKFFSISKLILTSIIDQEILSLAMCRLRVYTGLIHEDVLSEVNGPINETIGNDEWLRQRYLELRETKVDFDENLDIFGLNQAVKRQLEKLNIESDLATRLSRFGYNSSDIYKYYFDKQPEYYWKKRASELLFNDFVKIFESAGLTHGIILFEELEKVVVPQTSSARREFCEAMRYYFVDGDASYNTQISFYKILLTIHPYLQELLYPHWNASGLGRFAGLSEETSRDFTVYFNPIDSTAAVPLARTYLNESRLNSRKIDDLSPFTENSLALALTKALGVPGKYLAFLHSAIEKAIAEGWTDIDEEKIKSLALQDTPLTNDNDENNGEGLDDTKVSMK